MMKLDDARKLWSGARAPLSHSAGQPLFDDLYNLQQDEEKIGDFDACLKRLHTARTTAVNTLAKIKEARQVKGAKTKELDNAAKAVESIQKYLQARVEEVTNLRKDLNTTYNSFSGACLNFLTYQTQAMVPVVLNKYKKLCELDGHLKTRPKFEADAKAMVALAYDILAKQNSEHGNGGVQQHVAEFQSTLKKELESAKAVLIP
jgi:uncharacterized coiled-coil DUF342 family protein